MDFRSEETIIAPATLPGTGAISIVRLSGPAALSAADGIVRLARGRICDAPGFSLHYGSVYDGDRLLDEVLVSVFRAPHSYTGEDALEISCHASAYVVSEIIRLFVEAGVRQAEPGEFTQRAFMNGKMDLAQAESVADLISSSTSSAHRLALQQMKGGFSAELQDLRGQLLEVTSLLELELDFSEEDVTFADRSRLRSLLDAACRHTSALASSFRAGNAIKNGIPVAIVGPANAGKSTLLNAMLGDDRALVSDVPGTTRDTVEEMIALGGFSFRLVDTAGLRETSEQVESMGIARSMRALSQAEIVLFVLDATEGTSDLLTKIDILSRQPDLDAKRLLLLVNKCDLISKNDINIFVLDLNKFVSLIGLKADTFCISGKTGEGLPALRDALIAHARTMAGTENSTLVSNLRHFEALREASASLASALTSLDQNLPSDLIAEDLRSALSALSRITGSPITPSEVLGEIFGKFCIGK